MNIPDFTRDLASQIVRRSLNEVADFDSNASIEDYTFQHFQSYHKLVFLNEIKNKTNQVKDVDRYYDIVLNLDMIDGWNKLSDCIDYLYNQVGVKLGNTEKVTY